MIWNGVDAPYAEVVAADEGFLRTCRRVESTVGWQGPDGHAGCLDEMVTALVDGTQPMTSSADNAKSLGMVFAAIESAERGEKVPVRLG